MAFSSTEQVTETVNFISDTTSAAEAAKQRFVSRCGMFPWAFIQTPFSHHFFKQPSHTHMLLQNVEESSSAFRNFHWSITSTAEKCIRQLHSLASQNPFLNKLFSFGSEYQNFCQVRCRNIQSLSLSGHNFAAVLPGDSVAGLVVANGLLSFLNIYNTLLIVRLVLTWFPNTPPAIVSPLSTLCDPYLNIFRGIIPPLGGTLDLSPILAFLVLNAFTSTASALPAELPPAGLSQDGSSLMTISDVTESQKKWRRRVLGSRTKIPRDFN